MHLLLSFIVTSEDNLEIDLIIVVPLIFPKDGYFNEDAKYNLCYCESCHKLRGDEAYYKRGEPPRDYALPFGWCRFALRSVARHLKTYCNS